MCVAVATLVGAPTGGALLKEVDEKHFTGLIVFSGVLILAGTIILASAGIIGSQRLRRLLSDRLSSPNKSASSSPELEKHSLPPQFESCGRA